MENIPNHIAIIPDGNRRWATARAKKPWLGHSAGKDNFKRISQEFFKKGVKYVTFWAASESNLAKRSKTEIDFLLKYLREALEDEKAIGELNEQEVKVRILGEWKKFVQDKRLEQAIYDIEIKTQSNSKRELTILFGYDGKQEMLNAIRKIIPTKTVNEKVLKENLLTGHLPGVDFVIRTGGEPHWSAGFLMWLTAESQFYFTEKLWPDFDLEDVRESMQEFTKRQRRLGA